MMVRDWFKKRFVRQAWPDPDTDQLIKATLLPADEARAFWRKWKAENDIDACTWPQFKILARFSGRLPQIDPDCEEIPRLKGMAKSLWTQSQLQLNRSAEALDLLIAASVPVYLMKSAALEALQMTRLTRRVTSDIDVMVRRQDLRVAIGTLCANGWCGEGGVDAAMKRCRSNPGVNLQKGSSDGNDLSDVDVHHQPVHMPFLGADVMAEIWSRAVPAQFRKRDVLVPAPEELLVFTAMQGIRRFVPSHRSSGMWAFDLAETVGRDDLDWERVIKVAGMCGGSWAVLSCLSYLKTGLAIGIPDHVLSKLDAQASGLSEAMTFYAQSPTYGTAKLVNLPVRELVLLNRQREFFRRCDASSCEW